MQRAGPVALYMFYYVWFKLYSLNVAGGQRRFQGSFKQTRKQSINILQMIFQHLTGIVFTLLACPIFEKVMCLSSNEKDQILTQHNNLRRKMVKYNAQNNIANMQEMVWDDKLETFAKEKLHKIEQADWNLKTGDFDWTSINIGSSETGPTAIANIVNEWYRGVRRFNYKKKTCPAKNSCQSFENIVNPIHSRLGCFEAIKKAEINKTDYILLCEYSRTQAVIDYHLEFVYGKPCTHCDETRPFCRRDLCSKCTKGEKDCSCKVTCEKNIYGNGVLDSGACKCNCTYGTGANCDKQCKDIKRWERNPQVCKQTQKPCLQFPLLIHQYKTLCPLKCGYCRPRPKKKGKGRILI